jgi:hypothetical protein
MQKEELIQLHTFLFQVRSYLEDILGQNDNAMFYSYDTLHISPHHVHKSKDEQKSAVFELSECITQFIEKKR